MMKQNELTGVLPVFQMPYLDDDAIDYATLTRELDWLLAAGADGVVMAMVSEVLRLSDQERLAAGEWVCQHVGGRGSVTLSVGAETTRQAVAFAKHAQQSGADAVMAIPPTLVSLPEGELEVYYRAILDAVDIPVVVQDASGYVGRPLSIAFQAALHHHYGDHAQYKPEANPIGPRLSDLLDATGGKARIFEGTGGIALVDSHRRGIVGTMPGADLIHAIIALWRALEAGDEDRIYQLSLPISSLVAIQNSLDAFLAVEKHLLVRQGVFQNTRVRGPVGYRLDAKTTAEVNRLFDRLTAALV